MNFTLKNTFSGRNFFILGIIFITLTLLSNYILSNLITQITENSNSDSAQRNFIKRQEVLAQEFSRLIDVEKEVARVIEISTPEKLSDYLKILNTINTTHDLVKNNWFQINNDSIEFTTSKNNTNVSVDSIKDFIAKNGERNKFNAIIKDKQNFFWRIYYKLTAANGTVVRYGYDIDLKALQAYFSTINQNIPNYAFIFDKKGTIIYHPEVKFLEKNAFKITNLVAADTVFNRQNFTEKTGLSEYLHLDIVRYTKRLNVKDTHWYVSVNYPQKITNEGVDLVKKYTTLIYLITTTILLLFFYLFTVLSQKNFEEKEALSKEKSNLLLENEKISNEKTLIQLQQLKEQINPHFLFNSLNSLYMLIDRNTSLARKFTVNLSKIYRYLIDPPAQNIVTVNEELRFIEKYIFLQQTRFKDEFVFKISIDDINALTKKVPYLSFQIAVENAIKHNIASEENPLKITIIISENKVVISNNLNEKQNFEEESKFGLKYLKSIYGYYSKNDFETVKSNGYFTCILPLID